MNSCYRCAHLHKETESWEMPHIWWWECSARPAMANLKSFPFSNTKCKALCVSPKPTLSSGSQNAALDGLQTKEALQSTPVSPLMQARKEQR